MGITDVYFWTKIYSTGLELGVFYTQMLSVKPGIVLGAPTTGIVCHMVLVLHFGPTTDK
jgi:hypothetical protein